MAATVTHKFVSLVADGTDATQVRPSNWNDSHDVTISAADIGAEPAGNLATHAGLTTTAHGGLVASNDSRLTDARTASDVSAWAKSGTKPSYTASEVGADATGTAATAISGHTTDIAHGPIAHSNRAALDAVSGTNTGDQTLAGLGGLPLTGGTLTGAIVGTNANYKIGIGLDTPLYPLHVVGNCDSYTRGPLYIKASNANTYGTSITLDAAAAGGHNWSFSAGGSGSYNMGGFSIFNSTNVLYALAITALGKTMLGNRTNGAAIPNWLTVKGNASIGANYITTTSPTNGLLVEGITGIGTIAPSEQLHVVGNELIVAATNSAATLAVKNAAATTTVFAVDTSANKAVATQYALSALNTAPAFATSTGVLGEIRVTADAIYICTATNTGVKTALATW